MTYFCENYYACIDQHASTQLSVLPLFVVLSFFVGERCELSPFRFVCIRTHVHNIFIELRVAPFCNILYSIFKNFFLRNQYT